MVWLMPEYFFAGDFSRIKSFIDHSLGFDLQSLYAKPHTPRFTLWALDPTWKWETSRYGLFWWLKNTLSRYQSSLTLIWRINLENLVFNASIVTHIGRFVLSLKPCDYVNLIFKDCNENSWCKCPLVETSKLSVKKEKKKCCFQL